MYTSTINLTYKCTYNLRLKAPCTYTSRYQLSGLITKQIPVTILLQGTNQRYFGDTCECSSTTCPSNEEQSSEFFNLTCSGEVEFSKKQVSSSNLAYVSLLYMLGVILCFRLIFWQCVHDLGPDAKRYTTSSTSRLSHEREQRGAVVLGSHSHHLTVVPI